MNVAGTVLGGTITLVLFIAAGALAYKAKREQDEWKAQTDRVLSNNLYWQSLYKPNAEENDV